MKKISILAALVLSISSCALQVADIGSAPVCHSDVSQVIADTLHQAIDKEEAQIPDYGFASRYGFAYLLNHVDENRCRINEEMLTEAIREKFTLVKKTQLGSRARSHGGKLTYMVVESVEIDTDVAHVWVGAQTHFAGNKKLGSLCCCSGEMTLKRFGDEWIFQEWSNRICG